MSWEGSSSALPRARPAPRPARRSYGSTQTRRAMPSRTCARDSSGTRTALPAAAMTGDRRDEAGPSQPDTKMQACAPLNAAASTRLGVPGSRSLFARASATKLLRRATAFRASPARVVEHPARCPGGSGRRSGASRIRSGSIITSMRIVRDSNEAEMVAVFLSGELSSERFGPAVRDALLACSQSERLLAGPDLQRRATPTRHGARCWRPRAGTARTASSLSTSPPRSGGSGSRLTAPELARVRYIEYSYWNELSGGSRLAADAAQRISAGVRPWGISNERFHTAAKRCAPASGFRPSSLPGPHREDLVCLEGNLRLTAHALAGFPIETE